MKTISNLSPFEGLHGYDEDGSYEDGSCKDHLHYESSSSSNKACIRWVYNFETEGKSGTMNCKAKIGSLIEHRGMPNSQYQLRGETSSGYLLISGIDSTSEKKVTAAHYKPCSAMPDQNENTPGVMPGASPQHEQPKSTKSDQKSVL
jgi:hypothetical protein